MKSAGSISWIGYLEGESVDEIPPSILARIADEECVIYPTTTLPGLGCLPTTAALDRLFASKGRSADMPVSLAVASIEQAEAIVEIPSLARQLIATAPPASLSIILRAHNKMDDRVGGENIAIRILAHPIAMQLLSVTGPLTATSANPSGIACPDNCYTAAQLLDFPPDAVLSGVCTGGLPSTLVKLSTSAEITQGLPAVTIMREGILPSSRVVEWSMNLN